MSERTEKPANVFDPAKYLVNINGRGEYLEVKWRLFWLRNEHPDAAIETELVQISDRDAVFKARVSVPNGGSATGWGSESAGDFRDFVEKAETKAIGRALAALGYGTQFCQDHDFGTGDATRPVRIVDAPLEINAGRRRNAGAGGDEAAAQAANTQRATERQVKFIRAIAREAGLDDAELAAWCQEQYNQGVDELNRRDASALIEALQRRRNEVA